MQPTATPPRPRVLHVTQPVDGGVARVVRDLTEAQLSAGMRISVACPSDGPLAGSLRRIGCDVLPWQATRSPGPGIAREVRGLARLVAQVRPTLVHAHSAKAGLAARLAVRGRVPTVFQPHAWSFEAVDGPTARLALGWERRGARWASRVVCVSEAERATGERAGITARWDVIPNGVDLTRFVPARPRPREADRRLRWWSASGGCAGRRARTSCCAPGPRAGGFPRARLVLVGDGPDAAALRRRPPPPCCSSGPPPTPCPGTRRPTSWCCRPAGRAWRWRPLEAMACGRPVVVTDVDGARESLPAGLAARCLVPPDDPAALAAPLTGLLRDPPARRARPPGPPARAGHHDVRRTADAVADVYRELTGRGAHRVQGAHPLVTAESTVSSPAGQPRATAPSTLLVSVIPPRADGGSAARRRRADARPRGTASCTPLPRGGRYGRRAGHPRDRAGPAPPAARDRAGRSVSRRPNARAGLYRGDAPVSCSTNCPPICGRIAVIWCVMAAVLAGFPPVDPLSAGTLAVGVALHASSRARAAAPCTGGAAGLPRAAPARRSSSAPGPRAAGCRRPAAPPAVRGAAGRHRGGQRPEHPPDDDGRPAGPRTARRCAARSSRTGCGRRSFWRGRRPTGPPAARARRIRLRRLGVRPGASPYPARSGTRPGTSRGSGYRPRPPARRRGSAGKRVLDVVVSGTLLVLVSPVLLVCAVCAAAEPTGPAWCSGRSASARAGSPSRC